MSGPDHKKRIWGWLFFDWASQPYHTLLVTFVFGPYFAVIAAAHFGSLGFEEEAAKANAQAFWANGNAIASLIVALGAPVMGAFADISGRRRPWIFLFSLMFILGATALWWVEPENANLFFAITVFAIGFIGAEYALIFTNAQLPGLVDRDEVGRLSGTGFAFGYLGGLIALVFALVFLVEQENGLTIAGLKPLFGLDPEAKEGTRATGPFVALWFAVFMVPYFLWVRDARPANTGGTIKDALSRLAASVRNLRHRPSLASFLAGSMLYRDGLAGFYMFGGLYAALVLEWEVAQVGAFGIIGVISAMVFSFFGGRMDQRFGPKPVITVAILVLAAISLVVAFMDRNGVFGIPLATGSLLPDIIFMICGALIGGLGGVLQAASRSLMVRHTTPDTATEEFGLYGLAGRATAFIAPMLIGVFTLWTGSARLGILPVFLLFLLGLFLLRWTHPDGDQSP